MCQSDNQNLEWFIKMVTAGLDTTWKWWMKNDFCWGYFPVRRQRCLVNFHMKLLVAYPECTDALGHSPCSKKKNSCPSRQRSSSKQVTRQIFNGVWYLNNEHRRFKFKNICFTLRILTHKPCPIVSVSTKKEDRKILNTFLEIFWHWRVIFGFVRLYKWFWNLLCAFLRIFH